MGISAKPLLEQVEYYKRQGLDRREAVKLTVQEVEQYELR